MSVVSLPIGPSMILHKYALLESEEIQENFVMKPGMVSI